MMHNQDRGSAMGTIENLNSDNKNCKDKKYVVSNIGSRILLFDNFFHFEELTTLKMETYHVLSDC